MHTPTTRGADCSSPALRYSRALLLLAIYGLLVSCGGGGDGGGEGAAVCSVSGPAPAVLTWDAVQDATGYRIYYDTAAGMGMNPQFVEVSGGSTTTATVTTGLSSGTTYYFAATALDSSSESGLSNVVCKTIR